MTNKKITIFLSVLLFLISIQIIYAQNISVPDEGLQSITPAEMKAHDYFLADDKMKGRDTPSSELDSCAAYIAEQFKSYGLKGAVSPDNYFQYFNLLRTSLSAPNTFSLTTPKGTKPYRIKYDFVPLHTTANKKIENASIVFAGYGITAPEYNYDDYKNIDVNGKVVLIYKNEPQINDSTSIFDGTKNTDYSKIRVKIETAMEHGASGIIFLPDPTKPFRKPPNSWPSLMRHAPKKAVPLTLEESDNKKLVCVSIGKALSNDLFAETGKTSLDLFYQIDKTLKPNSFEIPDKKVTIQTTLIADRTPVKNVVAMIEGSDPLLKNEYVVIGGHYDHIGTQHGKVYNGADDNASGTSGVLEVAEAFAECREKPRRSVIFITFAGEEKGLFGSRYFADNPVPCTTKQIVAMLNLDMISRNDSNEVAIIGSGTSNSLKKINEEANQKYVHMKLAYDQEQYFLNSDHYSFYKKGIPVLFYNTKMTPDLHKPTDDPEKIIPEKMAKIGKLVFSTAWIVANKTDKPDFIKIR